MAATAERNSWVKSVRRKESPYRAPNSASKRSSKLQEGTLQNRQYHRFDLFHRLDDPLRGKGQAKREKERVLALGKLRFVLQDDRILHRILLYELYDQKSAVEELNESEWLTHRRSCQKLFSFSSKLLEVNQRGIRFTFTELASQWKKETKHMSLMSDIVLHSAYQQIIGIGIKAVPFILEELEREPDHWFWALRSITGVNPVKPENKGRLESMAQDWLEWGKSNGFRS